MIAPLPRRLITLTLAALPWLPMAHAQAPEVAGAASASTQRLTVQRDTLWNIAATLVPGREPSRPQVMVAILRANPDAFVLGNIHRLRRGVQLAIPSLDAMRAESAGQAAALLDAHLAAVSLSQPMAALGSLPGTSAVPAPVVPAVPAVRVPPVVPAAPAPAPAPVIVPAASAAAPSAPKVVTAPASAAASLPVPQGRQPRPASAPLPKAAASAPDEAPETAPAVVVPLETHWLPYGMLVVLVGAAVVLWMRRRPVRKDDTPQSSFVDEQGVQRRRRPKVLDVSQAAADMARVVETLQPVAQLVTTGAPAPEPTSMAELRQQAALKLDLARACMELGRKDAAQALLLAVTAEGSLDQQADASELMARLA